MVSVDQFLIQLLNGLSLGSIFVLTAMGLTIIFGLMGVVNFAHGAYYALGTYLGLTVLGLVPGSTGFFLAIVAVPLITALVGGVTEVSVIRPLYDRDLIYSLLLTFGLMLVLTEIIRIGWGVGGKTFETPAVLDFSVPLGIVNYPAYRLFVIGITALIAVGFWLVLRRSNIGMVIRAATENRDMVKALGIDISRVYTIVFAAGVGIAGLAGILHAPLISVYPSMGTSIIVQSFVVVVIGGLNSFRGSVVAGVLVGEASALAFLVWPPMTDVAIFFVMAVFLIIRPRGIFGQSLGGLE
jgi:branched-chain amino acid transport system permease protein